MTRTARHTGFLKRERTIEPQSLVLSLIAALSKGNCHAIADLHRQFNGMSLSEKQFVAYNRHSAANLGINYLIESTE